MSKLVSIIANIALYAFLLFLCYEYFVKEWDPWMGFVVAFVLVLSIIIWCIPRIHASKVSPGEYPFEED